MNNDELFVGVGLQGGLGNQMFQYAAGYALSRRIGAKLLLDLAGYEVNALRSYALDIFNIKINLWPFRSPLLSKNQSLLRVVRALDKIGITKASSYHLVRERSFAFDPSIISMHKKCYLHGYWQSPFYFNDYASEVKNVFDLSHHQSATILSLAEKISVDPSVAVHVRRGDYNTPQNLQVHGVCDIDYYNRAASLMRRIEPKCIFYIFSDEPSVAENLFASWSDVVIMPRCAQYEDMFLMSSCRHHIIANSSFSWWAAWLGKKEETITVAPHKWFVRSKLIQTHVLDLFPKSWILM